MPYSFDSSRFQFPLRQPEQSTVPKISFDELTIKSTGAVELLDSRHFIQYYAPPDDPFRRSALRLDRQQILSFVQSNLGLPGPANVYALRAYQLSVPLINNAIDTVYEAIDLGKLSADAGRVNISIGLQSNSDRKLIVRIEDNGCGISRRTLEEWTDRYFETSRSSEGHYLGGKGLGWRRGILHPLSGSGGNATVDTFDGKKPRVWTLTDESTHLSAAWKAGRKSTPGTAVTICYPVSYESPRR